MMRKRSRHDQASLKGRLSLLAVVLLCSESTTGFLSPIKSSGIKRYPLAGTARFAKKDEEVPSSGVDEETSKKKSISKDKAISALSQPKDGSSLLPPPNSESDGEKEEGSDDPTNEKGVAKGDDSTLLPDQDMRDFVPGRKSTNRQPPNRRGGRGTKDRKGGTNSKSKGASLLPPPLSNLSDDDLTSGLSSWEEFLGQTNTPAQTGKASAQLPTITDLFPPNLTTTTTTTTTTTAPSATNETATTEAAVSSSPVAKKNPSKSLKGMDGVLPVSELFYRSSQSLTEDAPVGNADDEELPFSAEQSDSLMTDSGGVQIRRNQAAGAGGNNKPPRRRPRKMVRRGMEMLVGGVPINVDPPQRSAELNYRFFDNDDDDYDWAQAISLNSRDFGPLLHLPSTKQVTKEERGLYCESFVHNAIKWDVCPKDLRDIVKNHHVQQKAPSSYADLLDGVNEESDKAWKGDDDGEEEDDAMAQKFLDRPDMPFSCHFSIIGISKDEFESISDERALERVILRAIVLVAEDQLLVDDFDLTANALKLTSDESSVEPTTNVALNFHFEAVGEEEDIMPIAKSIKSIIKQALDDGTFGESIAAAAEEEFSWPEGMLDRLTDECLFESKDEDKEPVSKKKSKKQRSKPAPDAIRRKDSGFASDKTTDGPFGMESRDTDKTDLFLGGGNEGVFFDYSAANAENAPFQGALGPLLLDAAVERAKQRYPRVIAIGDVHGCIDELQDLLRLCDYQPGDLVCFLGDLVCKGPDSISVVQMAREIGAIGIRGNHDFEVVRWYQAIQSGVDPPVVGSEHFHIASCLTKADMKWLYSLPWYISSKDLGALFVHAGFVAGIRLAKQNPRLMMNMRSILPDGTVTSKFFSNWPWARLWDGPQTVLFGHDADRGLQQYEHAIGLDTGCVYGGRLTACILPEKRLVSVSARREYFKYRRRHYD